MIIVFAVTSKAEAGRYLVSLKKDIQNHVKSINSQRSLPILLCLEDAINNLEISLHKARTVEKKFEKSHDRYLAIFNCVMEWYALINKMILGITEKGFYDPSTLIKIEGINFGISLEKDYELDIEDFVEHLQEEGLVGKKPIFRIQPRIFLDKFPGAMFFVLKKDVNKYFIRTFDELISLRNLYYKQAILYSMLHNYPEGTQVTFGDKGSVIAKVPEGFQPETVLKKFGIDQRNIDSTTSVSAWNSDFLEVSFETLRDTLDRKGSENLEALKKENEEIFKAYSSMQGFAEEFEKLYGVTMESFFKIENELFRLCYSKLHTVGVWKLSKIFEELNQKTGFPNEIIKKVVEFSGFPEKYPSMIIVGDTAMTSFRRLSVSRYSLLQNCFNDYYENDLKGKAFEEACRKLLNGYSFNTLPSRVDVFEPMLPLEICQRLWGKQKTRTDIDVLACLENRVLVIECKEIKTRLPKIREQNQFKRYLIEHYYKVKWISENFTKFRKYLTRSELISLAIDYNKPVIFFPIVVTNKLANIEGFNEVPLVTFAELKDSISKEWNITTRGEKNISKIEIFGRLFEFPCFVKTISL